MPQLARLPAALVAAALLTAACAPKGGDTSPQEPPAGAMEQDPNATATVTPVDFGGKAPADAEVKGDLQLAFGWTDKYGKNALVIGKTSLERSGAITETLFADHLLWEGSAWTLQRRFKEMVGGCQFDVELTALSGDWSVTDLDGDGVGEATFAWRAGCRSDVSPVTHKVLLVRSGGGQEGQQTEKYVLRGSTKVDSGGGVVEGGDFKVDPAFADAPKAFREHAVKVWGLTATETMR